MKKRQYKEMEEIYYKAFDLLCTLTLLNSQWLRTRSLINQHNYMDLDIFNKHSQTLDNLFSAEQQIRDMLRYYSKKMQEIKEEEQ